MRSRHLIMSAVTALAALALAACGTGAESGEKSGEESGGVISGGTRTDQGTVLDTPFDKPDLVLTDTHGNPYDLRAETEGHATLLFFGYTHCPDVCPLTMGNLSVAASGLSQEQRDGLKVVMVTSDPERDTPESLGTWLDGLDPDFVGLTGDFTAIQEGARSVGVHLDEAYADENGDIVSTHGSQVIAFLPGDDKGHVLYTESVPLETYERDLPTLIAGETP